MEQNKGNLYLRAGRVPYYNAPANMPKSPQSAPGAPPSVQQSQATTPRQPVQTKEVKAPQQIRTETRKTVVKDQPQQSVFAPNSYQPAPMPTQEQIIPSEVPFAESDVKCPEDCMNIDSLPLAMAYVPMQKWGNTYELGLALERGTIFPDLDLPFMGKGDCRRGR